MSMQHPVMLAALILLTAGVAAAQAPDADGTAAAGRGTVADAASQPTSQSGKAETALADGAAKAAVPDGAGAAEKPDAPRAGDAKARDAKGTAAAKAEAKRQHVDARARATLDRLFAERESARKLYDEAAGYAVFGVTKAGFVFVTGGAGTGVAVDKRSGKRTYMRMGTGGLGLGIGAQTYDLVILFKGQGQLERFVQGGWNASTAAQAAAGQDGVAATSSFVNGIAIFQLTSKGLMAQADLSGTRFWRVDDLN